MRDIETWRWTVLGTEQRSSPGAIVHGLEDTDVMQAEHPGEVVEWLAAHGPFWDVLDGDEPFWIKISPERGE